MFTTVLDAATDTINGPAGAKPLTEGKQSPGMLIALWAFVIIPFAAVIAAVPVAWGWGLTKGLFYAHMGWLFHRELSNRERFAPDLVADKDIRRVDKLFVPLVIASVLLPAALGGLLPWSAAGALSGFFWAGQVRIAVLHHESW